MMAYQGNSNGRMRDSEPATEFGVPSPGAQAQCIGSPGPTRREW